MVIMNLSETALQIERLMMRVLLKLRDEHIIKVIDFLKNQETDEIDQIINRRLCANALLVLNDVDVMVDKLNDINKSMQKDNINFEYRFKSGIHLRAVCKLMTKFKNPKVQELIIGKKCIKDKSLIGLLEDLPLGSDAHLKILSSVLMRHDMIIPDNQAILEKYLVSEYGQMIIQHYPWLLDILPIEIIPQFYKSQYDQEVLYYLEHNEQEKGTFSVNKVCYHEIIYQGKAYAAIPQPSIKEDLRQLYVQFDGNGNIHKISMDDLPPEEKEKYSNRPLLFIEKNSESSKEDGYIEFYSDQEGKHTKSIRFSLIDIVCINHPERYHATICRDIVDSCRNETDFKDIFLFCKKKSGVIYILHRYLVEKSCQWKFSIPNVCVVVDTSPAQTHLFSPSQSGILEEFDPKQYRTGSFYSNYPTPSSQSIKSGDFVVCERNGMIYPLDNELVMAKRTPILGFVNGIIIENQQKEKVISVANNIKYVFYIDEKSNKNEFLEGDKVSFFPSISYRNKMVISVALYVKKVN